MNSILQQDYADLACRLGDRVRRFEGAHVLVTGAAGFIGRYLCGFLDYLNAERLATPLSADLLDSFVVGQQLPEASGGGRPGRLRMRFGDVSQPVSLTGRPDYILHAAGIASPMHYARLPVQTLEAGTTGTRRMLDLAREVRCRGMLYFSSSEVYGDPDPAHVPTKESYNGNVSTAGPRACYDESKRVGETWSFLYAREYQVPVKIVRLFNVYGPGFAPADGRVVPSFIERVAAGLPLVVHGRGEETRTFCYIADTIDALLRVLTADCAGEAFNIGSDRPEITIRELAATVVALRNGDAEGTTGGLLPADAPSDAALDAPGDRIVYEVSEVSPYARDNPARRCPDITKLRETTGFCPTYSLHAGLERTMRWHAEEYGAPARVAPLTAQAR